MFKTFLYLAVICTLANIVSLKKFKANAKIETNQSVNTYEFQCETGYALKGRKDWTDQQTEGTSFLGFTCCPNTHKNLHYLNENYFCCEEGAGGYCMSNACKCTSGLPLKGGKQPTIKKLS